MDEVSTERFNWFLSSVGAVVSFILGWIARLQLMASKTDKGLAINTQSDMHRDTQIMEIKQDFHKLNKKMDTVINVVRDQKAMYNKTESQRQELESIMRKQAKIIKDLIGE